METISGVIQSVRQAALSVDAVAPKGLCAKRKPCGVAFKTGGVVEKGFGIGAKGLFVMPKGFAIDWKIEAEVSVTGAVATGSSNWIESLIHFVH
jgi:predicted amino acid dehydrogenase